MRNLTTEQIVKTFYNVFLDRAPDYEGLQFWSDTLFIIQDEHPSATLRSHIEEFLDTGGWLDPFTNEEFTDFTFYGAESDNNAFVYSLYKEGLGRLPDPDGFKYWVDALEDGMSRAEAASWFWVNDTESVLGNI